MKIKEFISIEMLNNAKYFFDYIYVYGYLNIYRDIIIDQVLAVEGNMYTTENTEIHNTLYVGDSLFSYSKFTKIKPNSFIGKYHYDNGMEGAFMSKTKLYVNGYFTESGILS